MMSDDQYSQIKKRGHFKEGYVSDTNTFQALSDASRPILSFFASINKK